MSMELTQGQPDALADMFLAERIRGRSYNEIALKHGVPAEEVAGIVKKELAERTIRDPQEYRALLQLRMEKLIDKMWDDLDSFGLNKSKGADSIIKAVNTLQDLHDLNEKTMVHQINVILDEDATKVFEILKLNSSKMLEHVRALPLNAKSKEALKAWPEWAAESATDAVEEVVYMSEDEDGVYSAN